MLVPERNPSIKSHKCEHCGKPVDHFVIAQEMLFQIRWDKSEFMSQAFTIPCHHCEKAVNFTNEDELNRRDS